MKFLAQHPDFPVLIQNTAESLALRPQLVLKDYWVTVTLRVLAANPTLRGRFLFKGGTSLSKGWKLIDRFSEDVDLLLTGVDFSAPPEKGSDRVKLMKTIRDYVSETTPLKIPNLQDQFFYFRDKNDWHTDARYCWEMSNPPSKLSDDSLLLEMGFRGGVNPHQIVSLNSMVGDYLIQKGLKDQEDLQTFRHDFNSFDLELLSPARTFFEKLLYLHTTLHSDFKELRTRHLYDVVQIFRKDPEVKKLIISGEYFPILSEAINASNRWYQANLNPDEIHLREGLILRDEQSDILSKAYSAEAHYYYRGQPSFENLRQGLEEIRTSFSS